MPIVLIIIFILIIFGPQLWVKYVLRKHNAQLDHLDGTGGELAVHLIERFELDGVRVVKGQPGEDHYDPQNKVVSLSPDHFDGKSLTAVAVATHEVGHAIQFHRKEKIFELRSRYLPTAQFLARAGIAVMWALPLIAFLVRVPFAIGLVIAVSLFLQLAGAMAYLIILPEEWDASFNKALPILIEGEYVNTEQLPAIRRVLQAAALTYFSAALANILHIGRWFMLMRR